MGMTDGYISILDSSLDKKIEILDELLMKCDVQKQLLEAEDFNEDAFDNNVEEKGALIDKLVDLDKGFDLVYENVAKELKERRALYAKEIKTLQEKITIITEKSSKLQVVENDNKTLFENRFAVLKKQVKEVKKNQKLVSSYYNAMNKINGEPVLF